jgi:hypothetical protein
MLAAVTVMAHAVESIVGYLAAFCAGRIEFVYERAIVSGGLCVIGHASYQS